MSTPEHVLITLPNGMTYKVQTATMQKLAVEHGVKVEPTPEDYMRKALVPVTDDEWRSFGQITPSIGGAPFATFEAILKPVICSFLDMRAKRLTG